MVSPITLAERGVEFYWGSLFSNHLHYLPALFSEDIEVEATVNGKTKKFNKAAFLHEVGIISSLIQQIFKKQVEYLASRQEGSLTTIEVAFDNHLLVSEGGENKEVNSKGQQIWTYDGTTFVALKIIETDTLKIPETKSSMCVIS